MGCVHYSFKDLFDVCETHDDSIGHFNFKFKSRGGDEGTSGPGIYLIFDTHKENAHRIIYIGEHTVSNCFTKRVYKHIASLTFRQRVALSLSTANGITEKSDLQQKFTTKYQSAQDTELFERVKEDVTAYPWRINGRNPTAILKRTLGLRGDGIEVSVRKFRYACAFWDQYREPKTAEEMKKMLDARFSFTWIGLQTEVDEVLTKARTVTHKALLKNLERELIWKFRPMVNDEMDIGNNGLSKNYEEVFSIDNDRRRLQDKVRQDVVKHFKRLNALLNL